MFQGTSDTLEEVGAMLVEKLPVFIQSGDLEVQERACCILQVSSCLVPRPSHVLQRAREKSGRPGRSGDVIGRSLRCSCAPLPTRPHNEGGYESPYDQLHGRVAEIHNRVRLHHQIDHAFPIILAYIEKHGYEARWAVHPILMAFEKDMLCELKRTQFGSKNN